MTDKELLELAAKAAKKQMWWHNESAYTRADMEYPHDKWDPLIDDGDALRLAVALGIDVMVGDGTKFVVTRCQVAHHINEYTYTQDKYAATRRAIVRAAAELGKEST